MTTDAYTTSTDPAADADTTRDELIALGQSNTPHRFIPAAARFLDHHPGDDELRLLAAINLGSIGLRTLALAHLERLGREHLLAASIRERLAHLADDRLAPETLEAGLGTATNTVTIEPAQHHTTAARDRLHTIACFRTATGLPVFEDSLAGLAALAPTSTPLRTSTHTDASRVFVGHGARFALDILDRPPAPDGYAPAAFVAANDAPRALATIAAALTSPPVQAAASSGRLRAALGPDAANLLEQYLQTELHACLPDRVISVGDPQLATDLTRRLADLHARQRDRINELTVRLRVEDDAAKRRRRITAGEPLRLLLPTSRFTAFLRYFQEDIAEAARALGHDARLLIEPSEHHQLTRLAHVESLTDFKPDAVLSVNLTRGMLPLALSDTFPLITWIQDELAEFAGAPRADTPVSSGPLDVAVGYLFPSARRAFGDDPRRLTPLDIGASDTKFTPPAEPVDRFDRFDREACLITRYGQTPDAFLKRLADRGREREAVFLRALRGPVEHEADRPDEPDLVGRLTEATRSAARTVLGPQPDERIASLVATAAAPYADLLIRQETARWAVDVCRRNNWRLTLFGTGWDTNPEFAEFAGGELRHGDELRDAYARSAVTIHVSSRSMYHQRLEEALFSGGLPLARRTSQGGEDLVNQLLGSAVMQADDPSRIDLDKFPVLRERAERLRAVGVSVPGLEGGVLRLAADDVARAKGYASQYALGRYDMLGDLRESTFASRDELEALIGRAAGDRSWREARAAAGREVAGRTRSVRAGLARAIETLRRHVRAAG
ncbi:MAG: hypothetical protein AAF108_07460 [Planctomycetota bacterium]